MHPISKRRHRLIYGTATTGSRKDGVRLSIFLEHMAYLAGDQKILNRLQRLELDIAAINDGRISQVECPALCRRIRHYHADTPLDEARAVADDQLGGRIERARRSYQCACEISGNDLSPRIRERIEREEQFLAAATANAA